MTGLTEWEELIFKLEQELKSVKKERDGFKEALASLRCGGKLVRYLFHENDLSPNILYSCMQPATVKFYNEKIYPIQKELGMDVQKVEE